MMERLSVHILCFIFLIGVVHSCYYETYDIYTDVYYTHYEYCIDGCCDPDVPGDQIPCCDATGAIIGTVVGVLVLIAIIIKICTRLIVSAVSAYTSKSHSHNEREVLIPPPTT